MLKANYLIPETGKAMITKSIKSIPISPDMEETGSLLIFNFIESIKASLVTPDVPMLRCYTQTLLATIRRHVTSMR